MCQTTNYAWEEIYLGSSPFGPISSQTNQNNQIREQSLATTEAATSLTGATPAVAVDFHTSVVSEGNPTMLSTGVGIKKEVKQMTPIPMVHPLRKVTKAIPNSQALSENSLPTHVKWAKLEKWLEGYPEVEKDFLISGYRFGFKLGFNGSNCSQDSPNLKLALQHDEFVSQKIADEINQGRLGGPFETKPFF